MEYKTKEFNWNSEGINLRLRATYNSHMYYNLHKGLFIIISLTLQLWSESLLTLSPGRNPSAWC